MKGAEAEEILDVLRVARQFFEQRTGLGERELFFSTPVWTALPPKEELLREFCKSIQDCQQCGLARTRRNVVFGSGNPDAEVMFVGEAPGQEEDLRGVPFVGKAGGLLMKIVEAIHFERQDVYIANMLKCRPPNNRDPEPEEIAACEPYLTRQIEMIEPKVICALGRIAAQSLLKTKVGLGALRGKVHFYRGIKLIVTYHPAALLRNPQWKRATWEDVKLLRREYDGVEIGSRQ